MVNVSGIPKELTDLNQWLVWQYEMVKDKSQTKVPYSIKGHRASSVNPEDWCSFDEAYEKSIDDGYAGVGFVFVDGGGYTGIDLDDSIDENGVVKPWALKIIRDIDSYTEISPSGTGVKIICRGSKNTHHCRKVYEDGEIEIYDKSRFFTITGNILDNFHKVNDGQEAITALCDLLFTVEVKEKKVQSSDHQIAEKPTILTDADILSICQKAKNSEKFKALYYGENISGKSDSEDDFALALIFAFYTKDPEQIARLMKTSQRYRDKWDTNRCGEPFIVYEARRAIEACTESYHPLKKSLPDSASLPVFPDNLYQYDFSQIGAARAFAQGWGECIKHVHEWGWLHWNGKFWEMISEVYVFGIFKEFADQMQILVDGLPDGKDEDNGQKAKILENQKNAARKWSKGLRTPAVIRGVLDLAKSESSIMANMKQFDTDKTLLNVSNGILNLKTGELAPHDRRSFITRYCNVVYDASKRSALWESVINRVMDGNAELIRYLQKVFGYACSGFTSEQCFFYLFGNGANGKSTVVEILMTLLSSAYSKKVRTELIMQSKSDGGAAASPDLAQLPGVRMVVMSEVEQGRKMAESRAKDLSGSDRISCRKLFGEPFEFTPEFKLFLYGNHKLEISGTDDGIWRRVKMIPFTVQIPENERDPKLIEKLTTQESLSGILSWLMEGAMAWFSEGLQTPDVVKNATNEYREESDVYANWIDDMCVIGEGCSCKSNKLFGSFTSFTQGNGLKINLKTFSSEMLKRGFEKKHKKDGNYFVGIGLITSEESNNQEKNEMKAA